MWHARGGHLPPPSLHHLDPLRSNIYYFLWFSKMYKYWGDIWMYAIGTGDVL